VPNHVFHRKLNLADPFDSVQYLSGVREARFLILTEIHLGLIPG
jgi:hypothetical protein